MQGELEMGICLTEKELERNINLKGKADRREFKTNEL